MPAPTLVLRLTVAPLDVPLRRPFGIAGGALATAESALVTVELADGTRGFGEAAPFPAFAFQAPISAVVPSEDSASDAPKRSPCAP